MANTTVQTQREGKVLTVTQQLIPQVSICRRGEKHLVRKEERGEEVVKEIKGKEIRGKRGRGRNSRETQRKEMRRKEKGKERRKCEREDR